MLILFIEGEISRDVVRTFQRHQLFRNTENGGQAVLERVLRRISETNWGLGYCQGMNYVAGAIMIAQIDPDLKASYLEKSQPSCKMYPFLLSFIKNQSQYGSFHYI